MKIISKTRDLLLFSHCNPLDSLWDLFPFSLRMVLFDENIAKFARHEDNLRDKNQMKDANEEHCQTNTIENDHWLHRGEYFVIPSCSLIAVNFGPQSCQEWVSNVRIYLPRCYHLIKKNKGRGRSVVFNQATQLFSLSKLVMHDKGFVLIVARNSETRLFIDFYLLSSLPSLVSSSVTCYLPVTLGWRISSLFQIPYLLFSSSQSSLLFDVTQRKTQFRNSLILIWMLNEGDNFIRLIRWRRSLIFLDLILRQESFRSLQLKKNRNREGNVVDEEKNRFFNQMNELTNYTWLFASFI